MANDETDETSASSAETTDTTVSTNQSSTTESTGSEVDTNTDEGKDKNVPYDRFHEVNEAKKLAEQQRLEAEERASKAEEELEALRKPKEETASDDDIDPETEKLLDSYAKKKGFVSETELKVRGDVQDLKIEYAKSGIPFDDKVIYDYSKKNGLPVPASKEGWRAMYKAINHDAILETERKKAVAEYRSGSNSTAEKAGTGGAKITPETKPATRKERIHAAAQRVFGQ